MGYASSTTKRLLVWLLLGVSIGQLLLCSFRAVEGDVLGAVSDGIAACVGLAVVQSLSLLTSALYIVACIAELLYDASRSFHLLPEHFGFRPLPWAMSTPLHVVGPIVAVAPAIAALGALLAAKLHWHVSEDSLDCEIGELDPLLVKIAPPTPAWPPEAALQPWPSPLTPPSPEVLCVSCCEARQGIAAGHGEPFQAIFGAQLPSQPPSRRAFPPAQPQDEPGAVL
mmetsp:Transcript_100317/g.259433  ORF Transcript_100317/g.259433 Transcript_100317/m.259433 type:complete len:226 (+) Transcript_100317:33-710(+)